METNISSEKVHDFALVLSGVAELSPSVMDALFEAGCDDATPSLRFGTVYLTFSRTAPTLKDAILSGIRDIRRANIGATILRVDGGNLVTQAEIARRVGRTRQLIHQYISGLRGGGGFPAPVGNVASNTPLWSWSEVAQWLRRSHLIREQDVVDAIHVETINSTLEYLRQQSADPSLADEVRTALNVSS